MNTRSIPPPQGPPGIWWWRTIVGDRWEWQLEITDATHFGSGPRAIFRRWGPYRAVQSTTVLSTGQWYHVAVTLTTNNPFDFNNKNLKLYVDGVLDTLASMQAPVKNTAVWDLRIAKVQGAPDIDWFDGFIDEVRISNVVRSSDWIETSFNNQSSPSTFYSIGSEDAFLPDLIVSYLSIPKVRKNRRGHIARVFVDYRVINQGYDDAVASELDFYLSRDTVLDGSDTYVGTVNIPALASGEETPRLLNAKKFKLSRPVFSSGTWYLLGVADAGDDNVESDETNNVTAMLVTGSGR